MKIDGEVAANVVTDCIELLQLKQFVPECDRIAGKNRQFICGTGDVVLTEDGERLGDAVQRYLILDRERDDLISYWGITYHEVSGLEDERS